MNKLFFFSYYLYVFSFPAVPTMKKKHFMGQTLPKFLKRLTWSKQ